MYITDFLILVSLYITASWRKGTYIRGMHTKSFSCLEAGKIISLKWTWGLYTCTDMVKQIWGMVASDVPTQMVTLCLSTIVSASGSLKMFPTKSGVF